MEERWNKLADSLFSSPEVRGKWWNHINETLSDTKRRKHSYNLEYLEKRFQLFDEHVTRFRNPTAVALAMFFQHLNYDPRLHGMSEESMLQRLEEFASDADLADENFVGDLRKILESALASSTPVNLTPDAYGSEDEHYFLDIEMAVLGSPPADYAEHFDPTKMRDEYGMNSDDEYLKLRLKVLRCFLQIPNIFATEEFRKRYEEQARSNINSEIETLEASMRE